MDHFKKSNMVYKISSRTSRATQRNPCRKRDRETETEKARKKKEEKEISQINQSQMVMRHHVDTGN